MEGTRPDGNVTVAAGDALVIDVELGHLFDYYLAGLGEKPLAAIRSRKAPACSARKTHALTTPRRAWPCWPTARWTRRSGSASSLRSTRRCRRPSAWLATHRSRSARSMPPCATCVRTVVATMTSIGCAATFSPQAAARLGELDREEAQWQQRITAWRAQMAALGVGVTLNI